MATFRLDRSTDAAGTSERIVDDHGVIALVKARGKEVNAGCLLSAAPELLAAADEALNVLIGSTVSAGGVDDPQHIQQAKMALRKAIAKAEGRS